MFERYTEKARRAISFARFEASQFGSSYIETEHLLLGLLRENKSLASRFLPRTVETIRNELEGRTGVREKVPTSVELPLSAQCKRVLSYAQEEAERFSHKHIGTEHLFAGLLREEKSLAAQMLQEGGVSLERVREEMRQTEGEVGFASHPKLASLSPEFSRDLTQEATDGRNDPLIGRENEMGRMIETLCRRSRNNPLLVGEAGVGKAALVMGLAQRIAENDVPSELAPKRIVALYLSALMAGSRRSEERVGAVINELIEAPDVIIFVEELFVPSGREGALDALSLLRPPLSRGELRCIASATPGDYAASLEREPWLSRHFHAIGVQAPDENDAIKILFGIRERYEKFHGVTYADEALECAVRHSMHYFPLRCLPDKAIDLIDEAGACVKLRPQWLPKEMAESQRRFKLAVKQMENAIANHEFEKAQFFSNETDKEKENLNLLTEKYKIDPEAKRKVTRKDVEEVIARSTGLPASSIGQD